MLEDARQHLAKKAKQLDLSRGESLAKIQAILDELYPGKTRAKSLNDGVLKVITESSAVASELRLNQVIVLRTVANSTGNIIESLYISTQELP